MAVSTEIKSADEATKAILSLRNIMEDLSLPEITSPTPVFNDNQGCIDWSKTTSTKNLRHFNIRENAVRESIAYGDITLSHIAGKLNPADLFTKEHKDQSHFLALRDCFVSPCVHGGC